ncbi:MAG: metalloregulator ArsR/SmtB family transcription factor [Hyphomonadaceae bacterium]|nr:metalloregulator ArsR/SmtB family transcription factor [Hyphomonadaceae bacterium]
MFISPTERASAARVVSALRGAGEQTRLRALALLARGELAVGELAQALAQSQPRISRHLRLLTESGLVERIPEGAWVFYRLAAPGTPERSLVDNVVGMLDLSQPELQHDAGRLADIRRAREDQAAAYFAANADDWARLRGLHLPDADIEAAMQQAAGPGPFGFMVDVGVGQGRMLEVFADRVERAEGFDTSRQMLAIARAAVAGLPEGRATVRYGDVYEPPIAAGVADLVTIHQVLHFLPDPGRAVMQAARLLKEGGRLVIADFAPHGLEFLREKHAHRRLGFSDAEMAQWCAAAGIPRLRETTLAGAEGGLVVKIWAGDRALVEAVR